MIRIQSVYEGDLHAVCTHGPSGASVATDAPRDNEGRGESFSPTDLLATSLASCMLTVMGITARRHGWAIEGAQADIEKHMVGEPRRVGRLVVRIEMPAGLAAEARATLERAARTCPVAESIHPGIDLDLAFRW